MLRRQATPGSGTESLKACATPENEFSIPGPVCMAQTPMRWPKEARVKPSAIPTPTRSFRVSIGLMPSSAPASKMEFWENR